MIKHVPPEGSPAAEIVLVGEAPANEECAQGRPFVGSAGRFLDSLIKLAGLYRGELYLTNICKHQVPGNKMNRLPYEELVHWKAKLIEEINSLDNPKVLVPLGAYALAALTDKSGITNFRGSPLHPKESIKHDCVVIPTFHPSIMHYERYTDWPLIVADLTKAKRIRDEGFEFPTFQFITKPTHTEVFDTLDMLLERKGMVTIDVETPHGLLSAIGLGWSRSEAISIPFFWGNGSNYWSYAEELALWEKLREVLPQLDWANQNVMFDAEILYNHRIELKPAYWDPMLMHSCLFSEMKHNLETITSIYTDLVFYKKSMEEEELVKGSTLRAGKEMEHWTYNCMDVVSAYWSIEELKKDLEEEKMMPVYCDLFAELIGPILKMNLAGVPVDVARLPKVRSDMKAEIQSKEKAIYDAVGYEINVNSHPQVHKALFETLGMKPYRDKSGKVSAGAKILDKLAYKYQSEVPTLIKEVREDKSFRSIFTDENIEDGRFRCTWSLAVTKSGRLASRKTFSGKGRNLQNVKRGSTRSFFIAEKGDLLVGGDQKQADARIVAYYSKDENYIRVCESGRVHLDIGKMLYDEPTFSKSDSRYDKVVKHVTHGFNYDMGPWMLAREANIPFAEAKRHHEKMCLLFPGIKDTYYQYVEDCIRRDRTLYNVFGRRQIFFGHIGESVFKAGYSFIPQSSVGDINKKALKKVCKHYTVLMEGHDGIIISVPKKEIKYGIEALREAYDVPFKIWDIERRIPIEIKIGPNWHEMEEVNA